MRSYYYPDETGKIGGTMKKRFTLLAILVALLSSIEAQAGEKVIRADRCWFMIITLASGEKINLTRGEVIQIDEPATSVTIDDMIGYISRDSQVPRQHNPKPSLHIKDGVALKPEPLLLGIVLPNRRNELAPEFDIVKTGLGYTMAGWDFNREMIAQAIEGNRMLNLSAELASNVCPWNCSFCFTEDPAGPGVKTKLHNEMTLAERISLIEQSAKLGNRSINFIGAGEPTIDPHFWEVVGAMQVNGITPIVYTEAALKCTDEKFVQRLYDSGCTIVMKMNSLWNEAYQNAIVAGDGIRKNPRSQNYFHDRARAIELLFEAGFAKADPTRLAFDTIICKQNKGEVLDLHRWARARNVFVLFVNYLPSGRSSDGLHDAISKAEQFDLFRQMAEIDVREFGLPPHASHFPYAGGTPCTIRGMGLYVKIRGEVFDCPGESEALGNVREEGGLASLWTRARHIQLAFDGGCHPRDKFWVEHPEFSGKRELPIIQS